jgi:hypothetical protein
MEQGSHHRHLSFANVVSTLAVFFALGGGSVAVAGMVADNSVNSSSVVNESLKSRDLFDENAVKTSDVVDEELGSADIATGGVTASEIGSGVVDSAEVAPDAITGSEIAASAVLSTNIADGTITGADIGDGQVDASEIGEDGFYRAASSEFDGEVTFEDTDEARNADYGLEEVGKSCFSRPDNGELVSADVRWENVASDDEQEAEQFVSEIRLNMNTDTATVRGGSDMGVQGFESFRTLQASAVCLGY